MKTYAPDYYKDFKCIADRCTRTCCKGWEIDIDEESLRQYEQIPRIKDKIVYDDVPHFRLSKDEVCPFLCEDGLCNMIKEHGEDILCQICRDHPRFRNYFSSRIEIGLGPVCEEAARIILTRETPIQLVVIDEDDRIANDEDDFIIEFRDKMLSEIDEFGPRARLKEYLIFRHIPDAIYDGRIKERIAFTEEAFFEITSEWDKTDGSIDALVDCVVKWSYDVEYDDEVLETRLNELTKRIAGE